MPEALIYRKGYLHHASIHPTASDKILDTHRHAWYDTRPITLFHLTLQQDQAALVQLFNAQYQDTHLIHRQQASPQERHTLQDFLNSTVERTMETHPTRCSALRRTTSATRSCLDL
jgi:hypothetical protein